MDLARMMGGEEMCVCSGSGAQNERSWYMRELKQEEFLKAGYINLRCVEDQDLTVES